jgi:hypothetical protein
VDKRDLIDAVIDAHRQLTGAIDALSDEQLLQSVMDDWTGKDLLAHIAWWHDHSALVIETLREGRQPYDTADPVNATDAVNERTRQAHLNEPPALSRTALIDSFNRLCAALDRATDDELFREDRWPWLSGEALVETILWDTTRHYEAHRKHVESLNI